MADVFLSYRNLEDRRRLVTRFATILRAHEISVWWDYGLDAGESYRDQITRELAQARLVIPFWCEESVASKWVGMEAELGRDKLFPARLQRVAPPPAFEAIHAAHLETWDGSILDPQLDEFVRDICAKLGKPARLPADTKKELSRLPKLKPLPQPKAKPAPVAPRRAAPARAGGAPKWVGPLVAVAILALGGGAAWVAFNPVGGESPAAVIPDGAADPGPIGQQAGLRNGSRLSGADAPPAGMTADGAKPVENTSPSDPSAEPSAPAPAASADPVAAAFRAARDGAGVSQREFRDCSDCPVMVALPTGSFTMGSNDGDSDEKPTRRVTIGYQIAAGKHEVTVGQYLACVSAGGCPQPEWREAGSKYNINTGSNDYYKKQGNALTASGNPIIGVSWNDARKYAAWLSAQTGATYRLLSEAEWEYAARAGTTSSYSFGSSISTSQANYNGAVGKTTPVGQYPANAFGLHDMHGNVSEWVEDWYADNYSAGQPTDGRAFSVCSSCSYRVYRGGSWGNSPSFLRSAGRDGRTPTVRYDILGFRVARAAPRQN